MSPDHTPFTLRAEGLRKSFSGVEVLHGVDLTATGGRVLAVLGENGAGKSTAMKILAGDYTRDAGRIVVDGDEVAIDEPRDAEHLGIRVIYQEFTDAGTLTVAENILLGHLPRRAGFVVDWRTATRRARAVLEELGVDVDVRRIVDDLSVAERQVVEIVRALAADARMLVFDEPTSALAADEVERLFAFIQRLKARGVAIVYITHRLDEVERIADDVVVFRDGAVVAEGEVADFDRDRIVEAMVGARLGALGRRDATVDRTDATPLLQLRQAGAPGFADLDLTVHEGEIVSLFGRLGCGALEVAEAVVGLRALTHGEVVAVGQRGQPRSPADARQRGIGYVPVDRKSQGIFASLTTAENLTVATWSSLAGGAGLLRPSAVTRSYATWSDRLRIQAVGGGRQPIATLSGGNQQKVVVGRWLARNSRLLVLAEPTRGVDVGARAEIYQLLQELTADGVAILVVSTDVEEVLHLSDRVVVLSRGRQVGVFDGPTVTQAALTKAATQEVAA